MALTADAAHALPMALLLTGTGIALTGIASFAKVMREVDGRIKPGQAPMMESGQSAQAMTVFIPPTGQQGVPNGLPALAVGCADQPPIGAER